MPEAPRSALAARRQPASAAPTGRREQAGLLAAVALVVGAVGASLVGLAPLVSVGYPLLTALVAAVLLSRRDSSYVEFVLWAYLLSPEVRRVVDWQSGWHPVSPVMSAAPLAALLCLPGLLTGRRRDAPGAGLVLVAIGACLYGAAVGVLRVGGLGAPAAALLTWLPPLALALHVLLLQVPREQLLGVVRRLARGGVAVLGTYGVLQYVLVPAWDAFWMLNADLQSIGYPEPFEVRVFGPLNSPVPYASVLGALLVLLLPLRLRGRSSSLALGVAGLALSLVRGAWLGLIASLVSLPAAARRGALRRSAVGLALPLAAVVLLGGPAADALGDRIGSLTSGTSDRSASDRLELYARTVPAVLTEPVGTGLGSIGVATKLSSEDGSLGALGNFDSGLLEVLVTLGPLMGLAYLGAVLSAVLRGRRIARDRADPLLGAASAATVGLLLQMLFINVASGVIGVFLWFLLALLLREQQSSAPAATSPEVPVSQRRPAPGPRDAEGRAAAASPASGTRSAAIHGRGLPEAPRLRGPVPPLAPAVAARQPASRPWPWGSSSAPAAHPDEVRRPRWRTVLAAAALLASTVVALLPAAVPAEAERGEVPPSALGESGRGALGALMLRLEQDQAALGPAAPSLLGALRALDDLEGAERANRALSLSRDVGDAVTSDELEPRADLLTRPVLVDVAGAETVPQLAALLAPEPSAAGPGGAAALRLVRAAGAAPDPQAAAELLSRLRTMQFQGRLAPAFLQVAAPVLTVTPVSSMED